LIELFTRENSGHDRSFRDQIGSSRALTVACKPTSVLIRQRNGGAPAQFGARLLAETRRELGLALIVEGDECTVECSIPKGRKEEAVMHVEPLRIGFAFRPWDDV